MNFRRASPAGGSGPLDPPSQILNAPAHVRDAVSTAGARRANVTASSVVQAPPVIDDAQRNFTCYLKLSRRHAATGVPRYIVDALLEDQVDVSPGLQAQPYIGIVPLNAKLELDRLRFQQIAGNLAQSPDQGIHAFLFRAFRF
jgi:hypothetical protein